MWLRPGTLARLAGTTQRNLGGMPPATRGAAGRNNPLTLPPFQPPTCKDSNSRSRTCALPAAQRGRALPPYPALVRIPVLDSSTACHPIHPPGHTHRGLLHLGPRLWVTYSLVTKRILTISLFMGGLWHNVAGRSAWVSTRIMGTLVLSCVLLGAGGEERRGVAVVPNRGWCIYRILSTPIATESQYRCSSCGRSPRRRRLQARSDGRPTAGRPDAGRVCQWDKAVQVRVANMF